MDLAIGFEKLVVAGTAVNLASIPETARYAVIQVDTDQSIRYRLDGTAPDAATGILRSNKDVFIISELQNLQRAKFIQTASSTSAIQVQYFN